MGFPSREAPEVLPGRCRGITLIVQQCHLCSCSTGAYEGGTQDFSACWTWVCSVQLSILYYNYKLDWLLGFWSRWTPLGIFFNTVCTGRRKSLDIFFFNKIPYFFHGNTHKKTKIAHLEIHGQRQKRKKAFTQNLLVLRGQHFQLSQETNQPGGG